MEASSLSLEQDILPSEGGRWPSVAPSACGLMLGASLNGKLVVRVGVQPTLQETETYR